MHAAAALEKLVSTPTGDGATGLGANLARAPAERRHVPWTKIGERSRRGWRHGETLVRALARGECSCGGGSARDFGEKQFSHMYFAVFSRPHRVQKYSSSLTRMSEIGPMGRIWPT